MRTAKRIDLIDPLDEHRPGLAGRGRRGARRQCPHPDHGYMVPALSRKERGVSCAHPLPLSQWERGDSLPPPPPWRTGRGPCWSTSRNSGPGARPLAGMCCVNSARKSSDPEYRVPRAPGNSASLRPPATRAADGGGFEKCRIRPVALFSGKIFSWRPEASPQPFGAQALAASSRGQKPPAAWGATKEF